MLEGAVRRGSDLPRGAYVRRLPSRVALTSSIHVETVEVVRWSRHLLDALHGVSRAYDVASTLCRIAEGLESQGLESTWPDIEKAKGPIVSSDLEPRLAALGETASRRFDGDRRWRSSRDLVLQVTAWIAAACEGLIEERGERSCAPSISDARDEEVALLLSVHGHHLVGERPLVAGLRDLAALMLVARALPFVWNPESLRPFDRPALRHPLALVESVIRAQRLQSSVDLLSSSE